MIEWDGRPAPDVTPPPTLIIAKAINATTDASGFVTVAHGGPSTPVNIQLSGRNFGYEPYLTALNASTFTVRFLLRSNGSALTVASGCSFDWTCFFDQVIT